MLLICFLDGDYPLIAWRPLDDGSLNQEQTFTSNVGFSLSSTRNAYEITSDSSGAKVLSTNPFTQSGSGLSLVLNGNPRVAFGTLSSTPPPASPPPSSPPSGPPSGPPSASSSTGKQSITGKSSTSLLTTHSRVVSSSTGYSTNNKSSIVVSSASIVDRYIIMMVMLFVTLAL